MRGAAGGKPRGMDEATITPYRDGPLLVRGPFRLLDQDGNEIDVGPRDDRALPLRQVAAAAVLRRHAQARALPRPERRRAAGASGQARLPARRAGGAAATSVAASQAPSRWRAQRPSSSTSARAPHRMSAASAGSWRARPPARSTAAMFSCTASAVDVLVEERRSPSLVEAEPAQRRARSGGWGSTRSSRTAPGGRRSRRASGGAGRAATSGSRSRA